MIDKRMSNQQSVNPYRSFPKNLLQTDPGEAKNVVISVTQVLQDLLLQVWERCIIILFNSVVNVRVTTCEREPLGVCYVVYLMSFQGGRDLYRLLRLWPRNSIFQF